MDHYATLGVNKNATPDDIKKSYRKLASKHHPDKGGDTSTFQKIEEAYRILSDPNQRQQYDNPAPHGFHFGQGAPEGFPFNSGGFADIFNMFQQHQNRQQRPQQQVFRTSVQATLQQVYFGEEQTLKLQTPSNTHLIKIQIPKGVQNGNQIRIDNAIDGASLMVEFRIQPDLKFDRKHHDLVCNHPISVLDLITGTTFEFTTISGKTFEVSIKPKTQPYVQLKIAGQGMPVYGTDQYGDQIILLKPFVPDIIDEQIVTSILQSKK
jgi:DnaJ-class molecular chaperone